MTSLRGLLAVVIVFLTANAATLPDCARADVQYFPIPAVSTSKNDGNDTGLIVPILITDPDGELNYIVAPMIVQNSIVGTRGTINLFRYEPGGREIRFIASYTEKIERKVVFSYTDPAFSQGRYSLTKSLANGNLSDFIRVDPETPVRPSFTRRVIRFL